LKPAPLLEQIMNKAPCSSFPHGSRGAKKTSGKAGEGGALSRDARRLLEALGRPGACALQDPLDAAAIVVRGTRGGISVGAGRFLRGALAELARRDLVEAPDAAGRQQISAPGRAHLLRGPSGDYAAQHRETERVALSAEAEDGTVLINAAESPLDWLRRRRDRDGEPLIDAACYDAGESFRRDLTIACLLPGVTSRWDPSAASKPGAMRDPAAATDAMIAARQRVRRACEEIGAEFADLLIDLCGFLKGLELIERERRWPARSGKVVVRLALARLADHYGLRSVAVGPAASRGIRTWQAELDEAAR
jgi:hypothetical protein